MPLKLSIKRSLNASASPAISSVAAVATSLLVTGATISALSRALRSSALNIGSVGELGVLVAWLAARALRGDGRNDSSDCDRDGCDGCDNCDSSTSIGCVSVPLHPRRRFGGAGRVVGAAVRFPAVPWEAPLRFIARKQQKTRLYRRMRGHR